jgi:uncharacterized protein (TIGR02646 family)
LEVALQAGETLKFDQGIYGAEDVKAALIRMQHGKCCFCESKIRHISWGDVEHFRPKAAVLIGEELHYPGYYWLAYEWTNLLFCCEICNERYKRNRFPLTDESQRVRSPDEDLTWERPLFINSAEEDPAEWLTFATEGPMAGWVVALDDNLRGLVTREELGLNRDDLIERRRERMTFLRACRVGLLLAQRQNDADSITYFQNLIDESQRPEAEYAGLSRAFFTLS